MSAAHITPGDGMFARWPVHFDPPARRIFDPAIPVLVNVAAALGFSPGISFRDTTPLRVRAEGLMLDRKVPGLLHAWARMSRGNWLAAVTISVSTGNNQGYLDLDLDRQWCPADAITPLQ